MFTTRVKLGVVGHDGINLYSQDGEYIGEIRVIRSSQYGAELACDIPNLVIKPKSKDMEDSSHNPFIEGYEE